jgi:hypothetical protein
MTGAGGSWWRHLVVKMISTRGDVGPPSSLPEHLGWNLVQQSVSRELHVSGWGREGFGHRHHHVRGTSRAQIDRFHMEKMKMKIMNTSNVFGLNFLQSTGRAGSTLIVGDYDPQSQTWGGIVNAQAAGGCVSECHTCCGNNSSTSYSTSETTSWTTYGATDIETGTTRPDYQSDDVLDSGLEGDVSSD